VKRLILLATVCVLLLPIFAKAQTDTLGLGITFAAYGVVPAYKVAPVYDPKVGILIFGEKPIGENVTLGVAYINYRIDGQKETTPDMAVQAIGTEISYWVLPINGGKSKFNFSFNTLPSYTKKDDGSGSSTEFSLTSGFGARYEIGHGIWLTGKFSTGKFGDTDVFTVTFGTTFNLIK
jgi:hypothetical protein